MRPVLRGRRARIIIAALIVVVGVAASVAFWVHGRGSDGWTLAHRRSAEIVCHLGDSNDTRATAQCLCGMRNLEHTISWSTYVALSKQAGQSPGSDVPFERLFKQVSANC
jgi:hypothetical protein